MNIFSRIRIPKLGKNNFDLSFENKLTCQMGQLVPIVCQEVLPGDEFKMQSNILVRFNPLVAPMMHRVDVYTHYFFVPNRLIWDEWEDFITGGEDGTLMPEKPNTTWRQLIRLTEQQGPAQTNILSDLLLPGSLLDYLGYNFGLTKQQLDDIKTGGGVYNKSYDWLDEPLDILPLRAYQFIYNEYYRNQNTQPEIAFSKSSGNFSHTSDLSNLIYLRYRNWGLDYFTSSLPFSQRGPEQLVPVNNLQMELGYNSEGSTRIHSDEPLEYEGNLSYSRMSGYSNSALISANDQSVKVDNTENLKLSPISEGSISIRELRRTERIQEWLERSARSGARYIEQIKGHFGIYSSDTRLQRPEYLGGGKQVVQISAVDQTSATDIEGSTSPLGSMAGKAISGGTTNGFKTKVMEEHGFIIGIMSVLPKGGYHQGLNRKFSRFDKLDYFWPEFQNIGDQQINSKELYFAQSTQSENPNVGFGYTPRYSEYKCNHDEVHGDFKTTLDFWHLNRKFASRPLLNGNFSTTEKNIRNDIFAVQSDAEGNSVPNMMIDIFNQIKARRCMLYYEDPNL